MVPILTLLAAAAVPSLSPGTYTNEEEVYFGTDAGRSAAAWIGVRVGDNHQVVTIDSFGKRAVFAISGLAETATHSALISKLPDGRTSTLRRARPVTCWESVPKLQKKLDGSDDRYFVSNPNIHDQGARVQFGGAEVGTKPVVLRMRNVIWPSGTNKPSLLLYGHTPESPERAEAHNWADPDAKRVGINLRWMQASCTVDTVEKRK